MMIFCIVNPTNPNPTINEFGFGRFDEQKRIILFSLFKGLQYFLLGFYCSEKNSGCVRELI
jgi:hypothetical protein